MVNRISRAPIIFAGMCSILLSLKNLNKLSKSCTHWFYWFRNSFDITSVRDESVWPIDVIVASKMMTLGIHFLYILALIARGSLEDVETIAVTSVKL